MKQSVIDLIDDEIRRVRASVSSPERDDTLSVYEWAGIITRHLGLGLPQTTQDHVDTARMKKQMVRIGQIVHACLESIERKEERAKVAGPTEEQRSQWKEW